MIGAPYDKHHCTVITVFHSILSTSLHIIFLIRWKTPSDFCMISASKSLKFGVLMSRGVKFVENIATVRVHCGQL